MDGPLDLAAVAREIIDANLYMALGTTFENGRPWVTPVYYAPEDYRGFCWVSSPEAAHSRNLATRAQVSMVVFNSQVPIGMGQGVYMSGVAEELGGVDLERSLEVFSRRSLAHGGRSWSPKDVLAPALYRLYRATATMHWVLDPNGHPDRRAQVILTDGA